MMLVAARTQASMGADQNIGSLTSGLKCHGIPSWNVTLRTLWPLDTSTKLLLLQSTDIGSKKMLQEGPTPFIMGRRPSAPFFADVNDQATGCAPRTVSASLDSTPRTSTATWTALSFLYDSRVIV